MILNFAKLEENIAKQEIKNFVKILQNYKNKFFEPPLLLHNLPSATHPRLPSAKIFFIAARQCYLEMKTIKQTYFTILSSIILCSYPRLIGFSTGCLLPSTGPPALDWQDTLVYRSPSPAPSLYPGQEEGWLDSDQKPFSSPIFLGRLIHNDTTCRVTSYSGYDQIFIAHNYENRALGSQSFETWEFTRKLAVCVACLQVQIDGGPRLWIHKDRGPRFWIQMDRRRHYLGSDVRSKLPPWVQMDGVICLNGFRWMEYSNSPQWVQMDGVILLNGFRWME